ncbi:hypothetical protein BSIN_2690 [Burkholderia singularis]|uniref:Uncharacterized protein n=1 Tax=Burkholderia singularis TaxID=1503053 RepID=A0A238H0Y6_9BURK|nr:hypothetical protein BSIN_2690 [Burkholderia singularis]
MAPNDPIPDSRLAARVDFIARVGATAIRLGPAWAAGSMTYADVSTGAFRHAAQALRAGIAFAPA